MYKSLKKIPVRNSLISTLNEGPHYSITETTKPNDYRLVSVNENMLNLLNLDISENIQEFTGILSGKEQLPNTWSLCYGGHQFQQWAGQLGDGRVISLAQYFLGNGTFELQLKGAGKTPYSRFGDGLAVLRSSIREYLCAEAMHYLRIPTSRSLSLIATSTLVHREIVEQGAIASRIAPSWIRFGSFEILSARQDIENLKVLADYVINEHFQTIRKDPKKYELFAEEVVVRTARLIAKWQCAGTFNLLGFCHGVMNTDNFSVLGLTIDYGPFQFLDSYDPTYICNHSDELGLYAFMQQPRAALWNLARFISSISPLMDSTEDKIKTMQSILDKYGKELKDEYALGMCQKLGFAKGSNELMQNVVTPLLIIMQKAEIDYTLFMRELGNLSLESVEIESNDLAKLVSYSYLSESYRDTLFENSSLEYELKRWYTIYRGVSIEFGVASSRAETMKMMNPRYILRNNLVNEIIAEAQEGEYKGVDWYLKLLQNPFADGTLEDQERFGGMVPNSSRNLKCSCSS